MPTDQPTTPRGFTSRWRHYWAHARFQEWGDLVYARPLATLILALFGGLPGLTPNRLTLASLCLRAAAWLLIMAPPWPLSEALLIGALLLVAVALDGADGQLARADGHSSPLGAFLDKVSDLGWQALLFLAIGWLTTAQTGDPLFLLLCSIAFAAQATAFYAYWVMRDACPEHQSPGLGDLGDDRPPLTVRKVLRMQVYIFAVQESDLHLWVALGILFDALPELCWFIAISQTITGAVRIVARGLQTRQFSK